MPCASSRRSWRAARGSPELPEDRRDVGRGHRLLATVEELRAAGYRNLIGGSPARAADRDAELFVAEGSRAIVQLLDLGWPLHSVLLSQTRMANHPDLAARAAQAGAQVHVAPQEAIDQVAGYHVHRGALALALRPAPVPVAEVIETARLVLVTEAVSDLENLGALFRNAAAFGAGAVVLDPSSADPLYRRVVRVSVGHALTVPFARSTSWPGDLDALRTQGLTVVALDPSAGEPLHTVDSRAGRWALLVGSEGDGLSRAALDRVDLAVRIPMAAGVDSLNVATAAAVALYHFSPHGPSASQGGHPRTGSA